MNTTMTPKHLRIPAAFAIAALFALSANLTTAVAAPEGQGVAKLKAMDKNGDGQISRDEASAHPKLAKHFDQIDTNKDGQLSADELRAAHAKGAAMKLKAIDKDGDSRISRAEAEAKSPRLAQNFDRLDTNKDGYLSKDELAAARGLRRAN